MQHSNLRKAMLVLLLLLLGLLARPSDAQTSPCATLNDGYYTCTELIASSPFARGGKASLEAPPLTGDNNNKRVTLEPNFRGFSFYGTTMNQTFYATNGFLGLRADNTILSASYIPSPNAGPIPYASGVSDFWTIQPFHSDLVCNGEIWRWYETPDILVYDWSSCSLFNVPTASVSFQVQLYQNDDHIEFHYGTMSGNYLGQGATAVGLMRNSTVGLGYSYGTSASATGIPGSNKAVAFYPIVPTTTITVGTTTTTTSAATTTTTSAATTTTTSAATTTTTSAATTTTISAATTTTTTTSGATTTTVAGTTGSTSSPEPATASPESSEAAPFPYWIIAVAAGCLCCCFVVLFLFFRRRRRESRSSAELPLANDGDEDAEELVYDSILKLSLEGHSNDKKTASEIAVEHQYARVPGADEAGGGNYHKLPQFQGLSELVTSVDPNSVLLDVSKRIGHGSYGDVFRGSYDGRDVAVKMLKDQFPAEALQSFYRETEVIARIPDHEHVVKFVGACPSPFMILTEFCGQGSLSSYLKRSDLTRAQELQVMNDVAHGMCHLATHGIVHRDLAARNILLTNQLVAKISDFGLSVAVEASSQHHSKTATGPVRWMAIESIKKGVYSEKSDVWAYSVTCWEIINRGAIPYGKAIGNIECAKQVISGKRLEFHDNIPSAIEELLKRCTLVDPKARPTFAEIVEAFDDASGGDVIYASLATFADVDGSDGATNLARFRE